jgi:hypothetical protein
VAVTAEVTVVVEALTAVVEALTPVAVDFTVVGEEAPTAAASTAVAAEAPTAAAVFEAAARAAASEAAAAAFAVARRQDFPAAAARTEQAVSPGVREISRLQQTVGSGRMAPRAAPLTAEWAEADPGRSHQPEDAAPQMLTATGIRLAIKAPAQA